MNKLPTFEAAIDWLISQHGSNYKVARFLGMQPHSLFQLRRAETDTRRILRTKEWVRFKALEHGWKE